MIRISIEFQGQKSFENLIRYIENNEIYGEAQEKIRVLGHHTADFMRNEINTSRKRPDKGTHILENSITAETLNVTGGIEIGIGNIVKMNAEAPYWEVINNGGYIPPINLGYFGIGEPPSANGSGQNWTHTGSSKDFLMKPKKAIEGIDYVGKAIRNLDKELRITMEELGAKFLNGLTKAGK